MKTFNLYCDESSHLRNDGQPYMLLAYLLVPYNQAIRHKERLFSIKREHNFFGELKWTKVSSSQKQFYLDVIDYFFDTDICFRALVVKKNQVDVHLQEDYDTFYYKMYYQLINHKMDYRHVYNIYLDIKDTLSTSKVKKLEEILQTKFGVIRNLQNIHSHESIFLQITDLILGAINYHIRGLDKVDAKTQIIQKIQKRSGYKLAGSTPLKEDKVNLFFIDLK